MMKDASWNKQCHYWCVNLIINTYITNSVTNLYKSPSLRHYGLERFFSMLETRSDTTNVIITLVKIYFQVSNYYVITLNVLKSVLGASKSFSMIWPRLSLHLNLNLQLRLGGDWIYFKRLYQYDFDMSYLSLSKLTVEIYSTTKKKTNLLSSTCIIYIPKILPFCLKYIPKLQFLFLFLPFSCELFKYFNSKKIQVGSFAMIIHSFKPERLI